MGKGEMHGKYDVAFDEWNFGHLEDLARQREARLFLRETT